MVKALKKASLSRNTFYLTLASLIQKALSFGYYFYLARQLGPENLGKYTFVLSFTAIFIIFMDFGLGPILTREGSKSKEQLKHYFQNTVSTKIILTIIALLAMVATINFFDLYNYQNVSEYDVLLVYLGGVIILLDTFAFTFFSVFRALKRLKYEAIGVVIYQTLIVSSGFAALWFKLPLEYILGALLIGSTFNFFYGASLIFKKTELNFRFSIQKKYLWSLLKLSAPFAIAGIFYRLNGTVDSVMLKLLVGDRFVGWYALAFKLTFALTVLPGAFATSYFPEVSYYFKHEISKVKKLFETGMVYMFIISLPITAGTFILAEKIILTVWGPAFEASIQALQILVSSLLFIFINYPIGNLLNACNRQTINTLNMGVALSVNIVLNFVLIPQYTYLGASFAALVSSVVLVSLGLPWVNKIVRFSKKYILIKLVQVLTASAIMGLVVYLLNDSLHLVWLVLLGAFSYFAILILNKGVTREDLQLLTQKIRKN